VTFYDKSMDRPKPIVGGLRIVQVRERNGIAGVWHLGFCDVGREDGPKCMNEAVVYLADEENHGFLLCEHHNRMRMEQVG